VSNVLHRNNVTVTGRPDGPALVFGHGFGCDQGMWRFVQPAFASTHRCVLFDHVGCGRSDLGAFSDQRHARLEGYAADVLEVLESVDRDPVTFVGHSASAMIGLLAAIESPRQFERIVLIAPSPRFIDAPPDYIGGFAREDIDDLMALMERNPLGWAAMFAPLAMPGGRDPALTRELETSLAAADPYAARIFARAIFYADYRNALERVETPALVVQCSRDHIAPPSVGEYMRRHLRESGLTTIDAAGHCPHMSHPRETIAAIRDFIDAE
jgi:sigma-B regulation protein RsbQ